MLPVHYVRFSEAADIGVIGKKSRSRMLTTYHAHVSNLNVESTEYALLHEMAGYEGNGEIEAEGNDVIMTHPRIDIESDARHGWRENKKDTSVVCLGQMTHKVLRHEHVTKRDDLVTQRHEVIGVARMYNYLEEQGTQVNVHARDRNMVVNKFVREHGDQNQNDTWHGVKSVKKTLLSIAAGPAYKHSRTWHRELQDKPEPVATHCHWAIRNCNSNPENLRAGLTTNSTIICHYQNVHNHCHPTSRCRVDANYEPSCVVLRDPLPLNFYKMYWSGPLYTKNAQDFCLARDTFHTEFQQHHEYFARQKDSFWGHNI